MKASSSLTFFSYHFDRSKTRFIIYDNKKKKYLKPFKEEWARRPQMSTCNTIKIIVDSVLWEKGNFIWFEKRQISQV